VDQEEQQREGPETRRSVFKAILDEAGLRRMVDLARELGVNQSTLTNIQSGARSASPELIEKIRKLAPNVVDCERILSARKRTNWVEPEAHRSIGELLTQDYDQQIQKLKRMQEGLHANIEGICREFDAMNEGDVFIYLSAVTPPLEMDFKRKNLTDKLRAAIANAIQRDAFFLYLTPTTENLKSAGEYGFHELFSRFKKTVLSSISNKDTRKDCSRRLLLIQTAFPLFVLPDFKWELFYSDGFDVSYKARSGALAFSELGDQSAQIGFPISDLSTRSVVIEIEKTICLANPNLPVSDRVPPDIVKRLKESAELAANPS
jgi:transcriptional regulator with XRE-family HTH domain